MSSTSATGASPGVGRALPIDHLRATLILLVIAHHTVLAYVSYAPTPSPAFETPPMSWRAFPIVDSVRAPALDLLVAFNDSVLMALLFFLAGLFTWRALTSKGSGGFLESRAKRLGLPFLVSAGVLAPLAYYPAYLQHGGEPGLASFSKSWLSLPVWPAGPAWFLWVLLAFSTLAAASFRIFPAWGEKLGARLGPVGESPWKFFGLWAAISAAVYVPVAALINPMIWFELGPFTVQTARILYYALYFVFGIALGAYGTDQGLLAREGRLAQKWFTWQGVAVTFYWIMMAAVITVFVQLDKGTLHPAMPIVASFAFVLCCAASSMMLLALFVRFAHWRGTLWRSLDRNAYGIYLVHYVFVNWLLLAALDIEAPAALKALGVFVAAALLSWGTSIALRRIPGVARVV